MYPHQARACRDEVLVLRLLERELAEESALLALVDDGSARVLCSTAVPLRHLTPGQHFNLRLALPGSGELFVTLCLALAPRRALAQWERLPVRPAGVVHARLAECPGAVVPEAARASCFGVFARFDIESAGAAASQGRGSRRQSTASSATSATEASSERAEQRASSASSGTERSSGARSGTEGAAASQLGGETPADGRPPAALDSASAGRGSASFTLNDIYTRLSGTRAAMLPVLERAARQLTVSSSTVMPIVGSARPDEQLWPVLHGALRAMDADARRAGVLVVTLVRVALSGNSLVIGRLRLPLHGVKFDGAGALSMHRDLPLEGCTGRLP